MLRRRHGDNIGNGGCTVFIRQTVDYNQQKRYDGEADHPDDIGCGQKFFEILIQRTVPPLRKCNLSSMRADARSLLRGC